MTDMSVAEELSARLAHLSAMFYRKCLSENLPVPIAQDLTRTYLMSLMGQASYEDDPEAWE